MKADMDELRRHEIHSGLTVALRKGRGESLQDAAEREVRLRGPQIMAAHAVLGVGRMVGDEAWAQLSKAFAIAGRCRWPNPLMAVDLVPPSEPQP